MNLQEEKKNPQEEKNEPAGREKEPTGRKSELNMVGLAGGTVKGVTTKLS